jgi:hypothetical protein
VEQCAVAGLEACAGGERFCGAVVAPVARVGTTGDLQPDPVPAPEGVLDAVHVHPDGNMGSLVADVGAVLTLTTKA